MGGQAREVPLQFSPGITPNHLLYPRFSTDRRWIAFSSSTEVYVVGEDGGAVIPVARGQAPTWGTDSNSIIYSSGDAGTNQSLWQIGFDRAGGKPSGDSRPITVGRGRDLTPTSSGNGRRIAFAGTTITTGLESRDFDAEMGRFRGAAVQLTNTSDFINFFDLSPDGRLALLALRRGSTNSIWRVDATRALVQLAADPQYDDENPLWSPDGKTIAFSRRPTSSLQSGYSLWTMTADGADPQRRVEKMGLNGLFTWMPDGRGIVHVGPGRQLYLLDLASGSERPLTNEPGVMPIVAISPDGNWIIYQCVVGATVDLHAVPTAGGEARTVVDSPFQDYHPTLSASGRWVYYLPDHRNLYRVPGPAQNWRTATPEQVTNLPLTPVSFIENPQISRDGRTLAYSRGRITSDIWLASIER
jgi:Tol biopolymer transport system component